MSHQELQIAPGVYITDFRKDGALKGITEPKEELTNDVGLLLDDCKAIDSKSKMLEYTIEQIKNEENWEQDGDFRDAVEENWGILVKFCQKLKQKILKLVQLKYIPSNTKIEQMLNIDRIQTLQQRAQCQLTSIIKARQQILKKQNSEEQDQGIYL